MVKLKTSNYCQSLLVASKDLPCCMFYLFVNCFIFFKGGGPELQMGQIYSPAPKTKNGDIGVCTTNSIKVNNGSGNDCNLNSNGGTGIGGVCGKLSARTPLNNKLYLLQETPFLHNLRVILNDSDAASRPVTFHNHARRLLLDNCIEQLALPLLLVCNFFLFFILLFYIVGI